METEFAGLRRTAAPPTRRVTAGMLTGQKLALKMKEVWAILGQRHDEAALAFEATRRDSEIGIGSGYLSATGSSTGRTRASRYR
jgi:hypothetical protein